MTTTTRSKRTRKPTGENREDSLSQIGEVKDVAETNPVEAPGQVQTGVKPAYARYLHARNGLADAFKGRERQDRLVYEDAQQRYRLYQQNMEMAIQVREKTEREALDVYRQAVDKAVAKASLEYRETMQHASVLCKEATEKAWRDSIETSAETSSVFYDDKLAATEAASTKKDRMSTVRRQVGAMVLWCKATAVSSFRRGSRALARLQSSYRSGSQKSVAKAK